MDTIQIAARGMRPMNNEDRSAGFYQLNQKVEQEMVYTHQLGESVDTNAVILGELVALVQTLEQVSAATTRNADLVDAHLTENTTKVDGLIKGAEQVDLYLGENRKEVKEALQQMPSSTRPRIAGSGTSSTT